MQQAVTAGLAGRLGGVVAMRPGSGEVLGFAGIAFSGLQPPGSTFKIVTLTGALEEKLATVRSTYPVQTATTLEGVELENANGEACGGSLRAVFAESCNSVFAPLGAQLGAERLVDVAERFGFNEAVAIPGAATSTIPSPAEIGDDLALGSSAIGQGRVQATTLQMATVAATIAGRGRRPIPQLAYPPRPRSVRVTSPATARTVNRLMRAVVSEGTGRNAAIPGVEVAGKTGTAELETTKRCEPTEENPESCADVAEDVTTDTDAWFAAFAPAGKPRIVVAVLLVRMGTGGDTAAPVARQVLLAGLGK